jgi:hypothetical protein
VSEIQTGNGINAANSKRQSLLISHPYMQELAKPPGGGLPSATRVGTLTARIENTVDLTHDLLPAQFHVSGPTSLAQAFMRIPCGWFWGSRTERVHESVVWWFGSTISDSRRD